MSMMNKLRRSLFRSSGPLLSGSEDESCLPKEFDCDRAGASEPRFGDFPAPGTYEFTQDVVTTSRAQLDSTPVGKVSRGAKLEIVETQICEGQLRGRLKGWKWVTLLDMECGVPNALQVVKEAPMRIRQGLLNQYKARWFVLYNDFTLRYYTDRTVRDKSAKPQVIKLLNVKCSPCDDDACSFTLTTEENGRQSHYCLQATSVHERRYWIQVITNLSNDDSRPMDQLLTDLYDAGSLVEKVL